MLMIKKIAAERHLIVEKTAELNKPVYFKHILTSKWKITRPAFHTVIVKISFKP